jgi:GDP-L-fucose synthase
LFLWVLDNYSDSTPLILSVGEDAEVSIRDVAQMVLDAMGFQGRMTFDTSKSDGQYKKTADNSKLMRLHPEFRFTPLADALKRTCAWFLANYDSVRK